MNPPGPFGSPHGGAFQAPGSAMKSTLFQPFGQRGPGGQGFFQPPSFGQQPIMSQPPPQGSSIFGQSPSLRLPQSMPTASQAPAFGQQSQISNNSGFSCSTPPIFGQAAGPSRSSLMAQTPLFGQPSAIGVAPGFVKQPPSFGQSSSGFGGGQMTTGAPNPLLQSHRVGFGQTSFGQMGSTGGSSDAFGQHVTQSKGFGSNEFSFKPANDAVFKPIFSASPEPTNPQTTSSSSSSFGASASQTNAGISLLIGAKSGPVGFSFSQQTPTSSSFTQNNSLTTASGSNQTKTFPFSFPQPSASVPPTITASSKEPTTPSTFSFSFKTLQPESTSVSGGPTSDQLSAFDDPKAKAETTTNNSETLSGQENSNIFSQFGKASKRKDPHPMVSSLELQKQCPGQDLPTRPESPRQPSKRPLIRSRGLPGGLLSRALSAIRKDRTIPAKKQVMMEASKQAEERPEPQVQEDDLPAQPPVIQAVGQDVQGTSEDSDTTPMLDTEPSTPMSRNERSESSDSLVDVSPSDLTIIQCRNVPPALNKKNVIEKHFARFGKVCKVFCRPGKNLAIVHFSDHAAAARAKKKGKNLHKHELFLLWQKKKQSKEGRHGAEKEKTNEDSLLATEPTSSPLKRPGAHLKPAVLSSSLTLSHTNSPIRNVSPAKVLQLDAEPQKEACTDNQSSERSLSSTLHHLIGQLAETAEEKYRLLEQRDKILRQDRPKRTDVNLSKAFVGTCPDMCPEKERYMRETRNQLSIFEVIPNTETVDHIAAIKEYSRSSADQEEPLPHELRPLPVLKMTMDYLVTQIMDKVQDNYRDWYDFVWNRTRSVRKDITQQRLCCPATVSLIEKCTRFHVHCAHHLCEEPMSSFDAKINTENMTKCLQSLKEMYEDLATHQTFCPREAEFRQYNVLLKLNDGDILREVQQFRDEVRNSAEVKFAVQAFAAVNSNNFVRFFKLVKKSSYLASCLLHRYFNQVRAKALKVLNMAHTVGPRSTPLPLEDISRMLMFQNAAEATDFIQQYGLNVNEGMVELSRVAYQEPDIPLSPKKSEIILAKKNVLTGQIVNGGPLPIPPQHIPTCSFDPQNKFRGETSSHYSRASVVPEVEQFTAPPSAELLAQFQKPSSTVPLLDTTELPSVSHHPPAQTSEPQKLFKAVSKPEPVRPPSPPPMPPETYNDEDIMAELDSVIDEVVKEGVKDVVDGGAAYVTAALQESGVQLESTVSEVVEQLLQEISSSEIKLEQERISEEKRRLEEARRRQEHESFLAWFGDCLCSEIVHEVLNESIKETASSEIQLAVNEKAKRFATCTEQVCNSLVEETLKSDVAMLVDEVLKAELQQIHKYIKRWRDVVAVRRQLKRQMRGFPAAPCCVDPCFKLKALTPSAPDRPSLADLARGLVNLGNSGTLAVSSTRLLEIRQEAMQQMRVHYFFQQLLEKRAWAPLNLAALVTQNVPKPNERIFWKALLLLPSDQESTGSIADRILSDWLEVKLGGDEESEKQPDGDLWTLCVNSTLQKREQLIHEVHIAVKASRGPLTESSLSRMEMGCELQGATALIMLLPALSTFEATHEHQDVPTSLLSALLQLKQLQQVNTWHCPLPLVILVPGFENGAAHIQKFEEALMLPTLKEEGLISEFSFFFIPETTNDLQGSKRFRLTTPPVFFPPPIAAPVQLNQALRWVLSHAPPPILLSCQTLVQLIEASLSHEFNTRVYMNREERAAADLPPQEPAPVIRLYNAVLGHVADMVASQDLCGLSWPPVEFYLPQNQGSVPHPSWNCAEHLAWLRKIILSLQLPEWQPSPASDSLGGCSSIFCYAAQIPSTHLSQPLLMSRLENLLEKVRQRAQHTSRSFSHSSRGQSGASIQIPWDDVVTIFIDHKLKDWPLFEQPVCEDAVTEDGDILVYFLAESLKDFGPPAEWIEAVKQTHRDKENDRAGAAAACGPLDTFALRQRLFRHSVNAPKAPAALPDFTHTPTTQERQGHKFLLNLEEEKVESTRSMEKLQRWLNGEPLDYLSTPLLLPSSTLLCMPHTVKRTSPNKIEESSSPKELRHDVPPEKANWNKMTPLSWQLQDLERQILMSHEEEMACRLKLNGLLNIVDD